VGIVELNGRQRVPLIAVVIASPRLCALARLGPSPAYMLKQLIQKRNST
jgi:hypothetical protein